MTKERIRKGTIAGIVIAIFLSLLVWFGLSVHLLNSGYRVVDELDEGWDIFTKDGGYLNQDLKTFSFLKPTAVGETVTVRGHLPEAIEPDSTLRLLIYLSTVEVFLDGSPVYSYGLELAERGDFVGSGYHYVRLPMDAAGASIDIRFTACSSGAMTNIPPFELMPTAYTYEIFYDQNIISICIVTFLFVFGIILTIMGMLAWVRVSALAPFVHIGIFSLLIGYWAMCNTKIIELYSVDLSLNTETEYMALYFAMCPLLLLLITLRRGGEIWKRRMLWAGFFILLLFDCVMTFLHFTKKQYFPESLTFFHIFAFLLAVLMLVAGFRLGRTEKLTPQQKILNVALIEILLAGVLDILRFNLQKYLFSGETLMNTSYLPVGVLIFILLLITSYVVYLYGSIISATEKETLTRLAYKDTLTELYNRSMSEKLFAECDEKKGDYTLINLDLNGLKKVNDTFGHAQGDQLIRDFAGVLQKAYGQIGTIARMGGDEFVVVLRDVPEERIDRAVIKMTDEEEKLSWERDYEVSSSYGIVRSTENPELSAEQLYKIADERMYEMKIRTKKQRMD